MSVGNLVNTTIIEPMKVLYRGHNTAHMVLNSAGTTVAVTPNGGLDGTNGKLPTNRPLGVLTGSIAAAATISGENWGCQICNASRRPVGLFLNNYEGNNMENAPGVASGKVTIISGMQAVCQVYIWETRNYADTADLTYTLDDLLYSSPNGLLTNQTGAGAGGTVAVAHLTHVPTAAEAWLGIKLLV